MNSKKLDLIEKQNCSGNRTGAEIEWKEENQN